MAIVSGLLNSMTWEEDAVYQANAAAAHGTLYTVTNYAGTGVLFMVGIYNAAGVVDNYLQITADGNAHAWDAGAVALGSNLFVQWHNNTTVYFSHVFNMALEFTTSLLVEMGNDNAAQQNIVGATSYGILSKEVDRKLVRAGEKLDRRDYVLDRDVMEVKFATGNEISGSKLEFLSSDRLLVMYDPDGSVKGRLQKHEFDLKVGNGRKKWVDFVDDKEMEVNLVDLEGYEGVHRFKVPIIGGVLDNQFLPKRIMPKVINATRVIA